MFKAFCCGGVDILLWVYLNLPSLGLFGLLNVWIVGVAEGLLGQLFLRHTLGDSSSILQTQTS